MAAVDIDNPRREIFPAGDLYFQSTSKYRMVLRIEFFFKNKVDFLDMAGSSLYGGEKADVSPSVFCSGLDNGAVVLCTVSIAAYWSPAAHFGLDSFKFIRIHVSQYSVFAIEFRM